MLGGSGHGGWWPDMTDVVACPSCLTKMVVARCGCMFMYLDRCGHRGWWPHLWPDLTDVVVQYDSLVRLKW